MLNRAIFARGLIRTAVFLPFIVSLAIVAIAWAFLLDPNIADFALARRHRHRVPAAGCRTRSSPCPQ